MITIKNSNGLAAKFNKNGAALEELYYGKRLIASKGIIVGRYANRIANGRLTIGDNIYQLAVNENGNTLHGGPDNFGSRIWKAEMLDSFDCITNDESDACGVRFSLTSCDGDQGFPGNLKITVTYTVTSDNEIVIKYDAVSDKDTVVNFTNHSYFNLNGGGDVHQHTLWVDTDAYTQVNEQLIPSGVLAPTTGTDYNLIDGGIYSHDLDCNFVLNGSGLRRVAVLTGLISKLSVTCYTDQPGMQVYNTDTEVCLETQHYPDSPNHPEFPSTVLKAGEKFKSTTIYKISK